MFYRICCFLCRVFLNIAFNFKVYGTENIPSEGAFILAPNHKSNFDPLAVGSVCHRRLGIMSKAELFKFKPFGAILRKLGAFPIQRGKGDIGAIKAAFEILRGGNALLMFPQGKRYKDGTQGKLRTGVTMIAHKMQVPVVPVYIDGNYKFRHKVSVKFGEAITFGDYYDKKLDDDTILELTKRVYDGIFSQA